MGRLERIARWLHFPRSFESIVTELVEGLENGTIVLDTPAALAETDASTEPGAIPGRVDGRAERPTSVSTQPSDADQGALQG